MHAAATETGCHPPGVGRATAAPARGVNGNAEKRLCRRLILVF